MSINVGDTVKRIKGKNKGMNTGNSGVVTEVNETTVRVEGYDGNHLKDNLKVTNRASTAAAPKTMLKKVSNFYKKFTDAKVHSLVKAGYLNGDLEPTEKAHEKMKEISFFANYDALVAEADKEIAEAEAEEAKK